MITAYHAKYFAHDLTSQHASDSVDRISRALFDASVDLNPHQIESALFAMRNPMSKGVILADEVGLGKTIEAALVLCQLWAERKRNLLVICPNGLRKQWSNELEEKFNLRTQILDSITYRRMQKDGQYEPLKNNCITIVSHHFPLRMEEQFVNTPWDLVVIDEAHKLRNAHKKSNKIGRTIRQIFANRNKILLTATPLQNSLMELYGLSSIIDEHIFGDDKSFKKQFITNNASVPELRDRLVSFIKRTLRKQVLEYIQYTERKPITVPFTPTDQEHALYTEVSDFLSRADTYALPSQQRHLTALVARKLLASSSHAIINTLKAMKTRLEAIRDDKDQPHPVGFIEGLIDDDEFESDYIDEYELDTDAQVSAPPVHKKEQLNQEIALLEKFIGDAAAIVDDTKAKELLTAIKQGFARMADMHAPRKAIIFTESKRTQEYLADFLSRNGYDGKIVTFSGSNTSPQSTAIYQQWRNKYAGSSHITGSTQVDRRTALIDHFRNEAEILIATEAGAEGINLQFCALVINYDLPWNPQRIEQRIGRCHRYGQKFDVVVINFLNKRNQADQRVLELLAEKFNLFEGVFGASDEVLGSVDSGIDFEKSIARIYDTCRTPDAIQQAFADLQKALESHINQKLKETQRALIEHFDEDIHLLLKTKLTDATNSLDKVGRYFWRLTQYMLADSAAFDTAKYAFTLNKALADDIPLGLYQLVRNRAAKPLENAHKYRLNHPLGERVLDAGRTESTPLAEVVFDYTAYPSKISVVKRLVGKSGWITLDKLEMQSLHYQDHLIFTGITDDGTALESDVCEKLFSCDASRPPVAIDTAPPKALHQNTKRRINAKISSLAEANNRFFQAERDKLDKWADDKVLSAEQTLDDTKNRLKALKRESRLAETIADQQRIQVDIRAAEKQQRLHRQQIFIVEDEIMAKRDALIDALEKKLHQKTRVKNLFAIRWKVV